MDHAELDRRFLLGGLAGVAGISALAAMGRSASAGPLNPPAGPIASTPGPEPRIPVNQTTCPGDANTLHVISQPGSYYLTGNIAGQPGKTAISITAAVTLDFMGHTITGGLSGVTWDPANGGVVLMNGTVRGCAAVGIAGQGGGATAPTRIERMRVIGCSGNGLGVNNGALVLNCIVAECGLTGISVGFKSIAEGCIVSGCGTAGFYLTEAGAVVRNCSAVDNADSGIAVSMNGGLITGNLVRSNGAAARRGIRASGFGSVVQDNVVQNCGVGIECTQSGNLVVRNTVQGSTAAAFQLVAGNRYGPIVNIAGGSTAAVNGNSATSTLGNSDPQANFVI